MADISLKNSEKFLADLEYTELHPTVWMKAAVMARTPGVGMLCDMIAKIEDEVVTTYVGHVGGGAAGYIDHDPENYHRVIKFTALPFHKEKVPQ